MQKLGGNRGTKTISIISILHCLPVPPCRRAAYTNSHSDACVICVLVTMEAAQCRQENCLYYGYISGVFFLNSSVEFMC